MVELEDIIEVELTEGEINSIEHYVETNFPKEKIDKRKSQWHYKNEKRNPNATGIIGEYSFTKGMGLDISLLEYLANRPIMKSDEGDFLIAGKITDVKTNTWQSPPDRKSLEQDFYCGNVDVKHFRKDFIYAFIFTTYVPPNKCYLMGYMRKDEFKDKAKYLEKGCLVEATNFTAPDNLYTLPYSQMRPINKLKGLEIKQIK